MLLNSVMCAINNLLNSSISRWLTKGVFAVEPPHRHYNSDTLFSIALYLGSDDQMKTDMDSSLFFNGNISLTP